MCIRDSFDAIRKKDIGKVPAPSTVSPPIHKRTVNVADGYNVQQLQRQSPDFIPIFDYLEQGILPDDHKAARKLVFEANILLLKTVFCAIFFTHDPNACTR